MLRKSGILLLALVLCLSFTLSACAEEVEPGPLSPGFTDLSNKVFSGKFDATVYIDDEISAITAVKGKVSSKAGSTFTAVDLAKIDLLCGGGASELDIFELTRLNFKAGLSSNQTVRFRFATAYHVGQTIVAAVYGASGWNFYAGKVVADSAPKMAGRTIVQFTVPAADVAKFAGTQTLVLILSGK